VTGSAVATRRRKNSAAPMPPPNAKAVLVTDRWVLDAVQSGGREYGVDLASAAQFARRVSDAVARPVDPTDPRSALVAAAAMTVREIADVDRLVGAGSLDADRGHAAKVVAIRSIGAMAAAWVASAVASKAVGS
jgi:hypothetical protein